MNTRAILLLSVTILASLGCRPKSPSEADGKFDTSPQLAEKSELVSSESTAHAGADSSNAHFGAFPAEKFSYSNLEKELLRLEMSAGWPRSQEQELSYRESLRKLLDRRKRFLFSVPIPPDAERDRNEAWDVLGFKESLSEFTDEQYDYAEKLMKSYSSSTSIEKLVIWELVRSRMMYSRIPGGRRGLSGTAEILFRREMAKLLFSALGLQKQELFDAVDLKTRAESDEAELRAGRAEKEIDLIYDEQSRVGEQVLEEHWRHVP